jgi:nicotinamide riboside kinase
MLYVLTGPESSGKTTLATALAEHFAVPLVAEQARSFLARRIAARTAYLPSDLMQIASLQAQAESEADAGQAQLVVADTDLQVVCIWWQEKFGAIPAGLARAYAHQTPRHYLLCAPDFAWQPDELRENPHDRDRLFEVYLEDLQRRDLRYSTVDGARQERLRVAQAVVANSLSH